jgi:DNA-binding LytR/AlgR family response regulator
MQDDCLYIISSAVSAKVQLKDVVMIARDRRKLRIVTSGREYCYYDKIENILQLLDQRFYSCLQGCYINLDHVVMAAEQRIVFDNGVNLELGRDNYIKTKQTYDRYLRTLR